jgi:hydroxymethylpyrimidine pyrophosphatase-like HAD family hydrolase
MDRNKILIMPNNAAVDATIYTKGDAILNYSKVNGIPLEKIAGIGDEIIDISFLKTPGLGFVGAPRNAQFPVIESVRALPNSFVSNQECFDAFVVFYELAKSRGITHVVSDRDGVVVAKGDYSRGKEFRRLLNKMKQNYPHVAILSGSSYEQNIPFMKAYGLDESLEDIQKVIENPFMLLTENGLIQINVLTGEKRNLCSMLNPELLQKLKQEFEPEVRGRLTEVLTKKGLSYSFDYKDQTGKVYVPNKESMVTFNIPREFSDGRKDFRKSPYAEELRNSIVSLMEEVAQKQSVPYEVLRN